MEEGNGKENFDPTLDWQGIDEPRNISTDSLEPRNFSQVLDANSETSNSFLLDRSIGPALVSTASSIGSTPLVGPMRDDGDAKESTTPTGLTDQQSLIDNRETEEYADGLARELINSTNDMEDILSAIEEETQPSTVDIKDEEPERLEEVRGNEEEKRVVEGEKVEEEKRIVEEEEKRIVEEEEVKEEKRVVEGEEEEEVEEEILEKVGGVKEHKEDQGEEVKADEAVFEEEVEVEVEEKKEVLKKEEDKEVVKKEEQEELIDTHNQAHESFQTEAADYLLLDCDKLDEKMEFTKNYSDDLLMGQADSGASKGESMMPSADLADFELPPYSGSSGGSEPPQQHSPVKRQSSSNSSATQSTSSHQAIDESSSSPNLSAVRNLLISSYSRVSHVLHWKRPIESGIIFATGVTLIITLTFFSIISVFAYSALAVILASALVRFYKAVTKALNRSSDLPFDHLWNKIQGLNVSLSPEKTHELIDASLGNLNSSLLYFKRVLLFQDKIASVKSGLFLYMLTYIGAWFNGMTLITIGYLALFSVPIFYQKNKTKIDEYLKHATGQLSSTISLITNKASSLSFGGSSSSPTSSGTSSKKSQ